MLLPLLHYITSLCLLTTTPSYTPAANTPSIIPSPRVFCTPAIFGWQAVYMTNYLLPLVCKADVGCWGMNPLYILNLLDYILNSLDIDDAGAGNVEPAQDFSLLTISATPYRPPSPDNTVYVSEQHTFLSSQTSPPLPLYTTNPVDKSPETDPLLILEKVHQAELDRELTIPSSSLTVSETPKKTNTKNTFGSIVLRYIKKVLGWNFGFRKVKYNTTPKPTSRTVDPMVALYNRLLWLEYAELFHTMAYIPGDTRSSPNYLPGIYGGAVSWCAKKQPIVALSSAEAEYIAMCHAAKELLWIRTFILEILGPLSLATTLRVDNQAAIAMAKIDSFHPRSKHIALRYHFIRHHVAAGTIGLKWVDTHSNLADLFTKILDAAKTSKLAACIGLSA